jgi:hypothetical protein
MEAAMKRNALFAVMLGLALLAGGTQASYAWTKTFGGTRDQVRNACVGDGKVLMENGTHSTCFNGKTKITVDCNDQGNCTGSGRATVPGEIRAATSGVIGVMLGTVRVAVDLTQFGFDADGNSSGSQGPYVPPGMVN